MTAVSAETKAREDSATIVEEAFRQRIGEKARETKVLSTDTRRFTQFSQQRFETVTYADAMVTFNKT